MKQYTTAKWVLAAAVSMTLAGSAMAQFRVGSDGHALDANNRVGSGGLNTPNDRLLPYNIGNNIVTGNVTGGRQFRGNVPYTAPGEFRGPTAGRLTDAFVRESSGAPYGGPQNNAQVVQPFYGASQAAPPPPGFAQQSIGSSAYVPAAPMTRQPGDMRLGAITIEPTVALPAPGQLFLPGPVDPSTQNATMLSASPLYGVRQWDPNAPADQQILNNLNQPRNVDQQRLDRLRDEVTTPEEGDTAGGPNTLNNATSPFESPQNNALSNPSMLESSRTTNNQVGSSGTAGNRRRLMSPAQQSTQYSQLQQRLQQYESVRVANETSDRNQMNRNLAQSRQGQGQGQSPTANNANRGGNPAGTPGVATPGGVTPGRIGAPGAGTMAAGGTGAMPNLPMPGAVSTAPPGGIEFSPSAPAPANNASPDRPAPLKITSLAEGVQAPALAEILKEAEKEMKAGRFNTALSQYDLAENTVPNNPLVNLGRANVELAQSYYGRAAQHLREAFMNENGRPLLMGQVDLRSWFGNEKLEFLVNDLKASASRETKEPRHVFLLAYIAYNTGNEAAASGYLSLAEQRSEGKDELYPLLRRYWSLPQSPTLNK